MLKLRTLKTNIKSTKCFGMKIMFLNFPEIIGINEVFKKNRVLVLKTGCD